MITDLFIVTYSKDFPYLRHCLRSIGKFCTGFSALRVLVPYSDVVGVMQMFETSGIPFRAAVEGYFEEPGRGMVQHMRNIIHADDYTMADVIAHLDADCIFTAPVTPESLMTEGKPILRYEPFETINQRHPGVRMWQECTTACLPFPVKYETMRCHPGVFLKSTYPLTRELMKEATGKPASEYIMAQRNSFPQTFCEFVTLGNVALVKQRDLYYPVKQEGNRPVPDNNLQQFWGHGDIGQPQDIWVKGEQKPVIPIQMINEVLGPEKRWIPTPEEEARMAE